VFERFTHRARAVVHGAGEEATGLGHTWLGTEHLLLGLFGDPDVADLLSSVGVHRAAVLEDLEAILGECDEPRLIRPDADALRSVGIDLDAIRHSVEESFGPGALEATSAWRRSRSVRFCPRSKKVLELALREAIALGHRHLGPEHILLGILREGMGIACLILSSQAGSPGRVRAAVMDRIRRTA
jgi:ATP-dependent Clp protease ATP-binding subunit ClpA